ncbi:DUF1187 family protein [Salmonella enterica]
MPKYQINATIKKPGGGPVKWTHYSDFPMTAEECRKNFSKEKEAGKCFSVDVHISDFICKEIPPHKCRKYIWLILVPLNKP